MLKKLKVQKWLQCLIYYLMTLYELYNNNNTVKKYQSTGELKRAYTSTSHSC